MALPEGVNVPCPRQLGAADYASKEVIFDQIALLPPGAATEDGRKAETPMVLRPSEVERGGDGRPGGKIRAIAGRLVADLATLQRPSTKELSSPAFSTSAPFPYDHLALLEKLVLATNRAG